MRQTEMELRAHATEAGFDVIKSAPGLYAPEGESGYSLVIWLGQSSLTYHTWPEDEWVFVDVSTCGDETYCKEAAYKLLKIQKEYFNAEHAELSDGGTPLRSHRE